MDTRKLGAVETRRGELGQPTMADAAVLSARKHDTKSERASGEGRGSEGERARIRCLLK
jgi:hypothetical protein